MSFTVDAVQKYAGQLSIFLLFFLEMLPIEDSDHRQISIFNGENFLCIHINAIARAAKSLSVYIWQRVIGLNCVFVWGEDDFE